MNVAILPIRPLFRRGVSRMGPGKLVWDLLPHPYPRPHPWLFLLPLQHPLLRGRLKAKEMW